jgi:exosortase/archaeosortase family protein
MPMHNRRMASALTAADGSREVLPAWRAAAVGIVAAGAGALLVQSVPPVRIDLFAAGAAKLAAMLLGAGVERTNGAWVIAFGDRSVAVTAACSGTDFFLMVCVLVGWRLLGHEKSFARAVFASLALALPITLLVNALRVVAVAQAHRWVIPLLPERHAAFAHMFTGVAVFLPSLIALNSVLEMYAKRHRPTAA